MTDGRRRRRRTWSAAQKRTIVAETLVPGESAAAAAQLQEVNANLVFKWLREAGNRRRVSCREERTDKAGSFVSLAS